MLYVFDTLGFRFGGIWGYMWIYVFFMGIRGLLLLFMVEIVNCFKIRWKSKYKGCYIYLNFLS